MATDPELVIVYGDHRRNYLECYTMEAIDEVDAKIDALPRGSHGAQDAAAPVPRPVLADNGGRDRPVWSCPPSCVRRLNWRARRSFIAAGDTFQIWKPETYEAEELAKTEAWLDDLPDDFDPLVYLDGAKGE